MSENFYISQTVCLTFGCSNINKKVFYAYIYFTSFGNLLMCEVEPNSNEIRTKVKGAGVAPQLMTQD